LEGHRRGHGATHAKFARRIVRRTDHAASFPAAADGERYITQRGIVAHFHCCEKAVHINVYYFTHRRPSPILDKYTAYLLFMRSSCNDFVSIGIISVNGVIKHSVNALIRTCEKLP